MKLVTTQTIVGIIKRNDIKYATSSSTRIRGYHNTTNGAKVQQLNATISIYWSGAKNSRHALTKLQAVKAALNEAGIKTHWTFVGELKIPYLKVTTRVMEE